MYIIYRCMLYICSNKVYTITVIPMYYSNNNNYSPVCKGSKLSTQQIFNTTIIIFNIIIAHTKSTQHKAIINQHCLATKSYALVTYASGNTETVLV